MWTASHVKLGVRASEEGAAASDAYQTFLLCCLVIRRVLLGLTVCCSIVLGDCLVFCDVLHITLHRGVSYLLAHLAKVLLVNFRPSPLREKLFPAGSASTIDRVSV